MVARPPSLARAVRCLLCRRLALRILALLVGPWLIPREAAAQEGPLAPGTVSVTPDGGYDPDRPKNSTGHTTTFTAFNNTSATITFSFTCWEVGGVTCTNISPSSKQLGPGGSQVLTVTYNVGASGGEIRADMEGGGYYDDGYKLVSTPPTLTVVVPSVTQGVDTGLVHTRTPLVLATYSTTDAPLDTTTLVVKWGADTVTPLARRNRRLAEWEVDSTRQLSPGVAKTLVVKICHVNASCATVTRQVVLDDSGNPLVSFAAMPLERFGSGAETETGFAIPAYRAFGRAQGAGLVYSTRQSYPRALVNVDIELTWPTGNPDQIKAVLLDGVLRLDSLVVTSPVCQAATGRRCRVTLQGDFSTSTYVRAVRKWLKVEVRVTSGAVVKATTDSVEAVLVDRRTSAYGSGWFVAGVMRLDSAGTDMLLVGPTGTASLFRGSGGYYLAPPGDRSLLTWTGSAWQLTGPARGSLDVSKVVFDAQGRHTNTVDARNNGYQAFYAAVDRVDSLKDQAGKKVTFAYNGSLKLTTITDPGGRQSTDTINASNQLTYYSLASPGTNPIVGTFAYTTYGGNNTLVLSSWTDALGQATSVTYDARRRAKQTTLPAVLPETGSTPVSPVIAYRAQELRGLDTLLSLDSVFGRVVDPRGNWTRSRLNRWGGAERVWDALGTFSRAAYGVDGRVLWSEGKVADSTRVSQVYDAKGRPMRSYRVRTATDTVLVDSLVYDATYERVTKRYNPLRQATTFTYTNYGDVDKVATPTSDTSSYTYLTNGQLSQTKPPLATGWTVYTYDAIWKNLEKVTNAAGVELAKNFFDGHGRTTESRRKLTVRMRGEPQLPDTMQWRRTRTWYDAANRVDSVRAERTDNCAAPCDVPPAWPTDTAYWQQVRHIYDRLSRDTARVNTRGKRTRYAYDGLGRLRMRWPFADSAAVVDSFRYDVGGNRRFHWTRRAHLIEHRYDARSRDTLTIVPGVGNYRRTFGGPLDQLTRAWIHSYGDSIGGVNPEVRWGYSQWGLLLADTAQGNRVATSLYDRYGRDSVVTDVTGTWLMRYDGVRGVLDTMITAFGDTLRWTIDQRWRPVGPYVGNGNNADYSLVPAWDQVGKLIDLHTTHAVTVGRWEVDATMPDVQLRPLWTETQGSVGPTVSAEDTLGHDGWGRVTAVAYRKNGSAFASETFKLDRDANLRVNIESRDYDLATTRLKSRAGSRYYTYDRAGNLVKDSLGGGGDTWVYGYDALDRLQVVRKNGSLIARYAYDVLSRRIVKRVYSGANAGYLRMIYRGSHVVAEADSGGVLTLGYTWTLGVDRLLAIHKYSDGTDYYVVQDALGSVRGLTKRDAGGTWQASWRYRVYGAVLDSAGAAPVAVRYRWTGRELDQETGLYYFRARYYDPAVQRFIQEDPIGYAGGLNLYGYGDGNPTNGRDPDGLTATIDRNAYDPNDYCKLSSANCDDSGGGSSRDDNPWDWIDAVRAHNDDAWAAIDRAREAERQQQAQAQPLSGEQQAALGNFCEKQPVVCDKARMHNTLGGILAPTAMTFGHTIAFREGTNINSTDREFVALLAHELTHVVQYRELGAVAFYGRAIWEHTLGRLFHGNPYSVDRFDRPFGSYRLEQQGTIVHLCYLNPSSAACGASPYRP